jgi:hypothetical protein
MGRLIFALVEKSAATCSRLESSYNALSSTLRPLGWCVWCADRRFHLRLAERIVAQGDDLMFLQKRAEVKDRMRQAFLRGECSRTKSRLVEKVERRILEA